jgi:hypothetical protein
MLSLFSGEVNYFRKVGCLQWSIKAGGCCSPFPRSIMMSSDFSGDLMESLGKPMASDPLSDGVLIVGPLQKLVSGFGLVGIICCCHR